jgi:hypothetical protein
MVQWQVRLVLLTHADTIFNGALSSVFLVREFKLWKMLPGAIVALEKFGPVDLWHWKLVFRFRGHFERAQDTHFFVVREPLFLVKSPQALFQVMPLQLKNWNHEAREGGLLSGTRHSLVT